ncbi:hypothetical protein [Polyangium aurulentum]|uniref:hypothetical protein n=1 Tax=Polyangium aurulentum TaxID=2567896 RepID=UPI0010AE3AD6|nr:hypothetical protein [Polyangium aurulentum]UQA62695.1 hypothetical protein E8A73_020460 [Polyangium aurulentum]
MKRTLAFALTEGLMVLVHGKEPPSDAEWDRYLDAWFVFLGQRGESRLLVVDAGGPPTSAQRQRMVERVRGLSRPSGRVAILTEAPFARMVVNALAATEESWLGGIYRAIKRTPGESYVYRAFGKEDVRRALTWLELPLLREADVRRTIAALEAEIARG